MLRPTRLPAAAALVGALLLAASAAATPSHPRALAKPAATPAAAPFAAARIPATTAARRAKSVLLFGMEQDVNGFNTALTCCTSLWAQTAGVAPTIRGAFVVTNTLAYVPDLATKVVATRAGITYTIRPDASWYWGGHKLPVTYRDFVYTWKQLVDPKNDVASRDGYDRITGFSHKGEKQVTFRWSTPYADYRDLFNIVYPSRALAGIDFDKTWASCICGNDGKPVADGPFYLSRYTKGQGLALKANPYWYGRKPGLKEIDFRIVTDTNAEIQAMRGGELDAIEPSPQLALSTLRDASNLSYSVVPGLYQERIDIQFGPKGQPLLRAPWFRQAVMLGIDRAATVKALFGTIAPSLKPLDNLFYYQTNAADYRPDFARWNYAPAKAIALLRKHGCTGGPSTPDAGTTKTWTCAGYPARITYTTTAGNARRESSATIVAAQLRAIGIDVEARLQPSNVVFGPTVLAAGNYQLLEYASITPPDPANFVAIWSCGGGSNFRGYCNAKATALMHAADGELDPAKRSALFRQADVLLARDVPAIPLYETPTILVRKSTVVGMKNSPVFPTWNIQDWAWKKS